MTSRSHISHIARKVLKKAAGGLAICALLAAPLLAEGHHFQGEDRGTNRRQAAPVERRADPGQPPANYNRPAQPGAPGNGGQRQAVTPGRPGQNQQHLAQWMDSHRNMPLSQQQSALESEPGFHQLKPQEQQRMHDRLSQLNNMQPQQQQRVLQRTEAMERLQPAQRQQVRAAAAQLGGLPIDRQRAVAHTFHAALDLPENQRQTWINSPEVRGQFNDRERDTLNNLLQVAPTAGQAGLPGFQSHSQRQAPPQ